MYFNFETPPEDAGGLPLLVNVDRIAHDTVVDGIKIDDVAVELDPHITELLRRTIARFNTETLETGHFRDCIHFVMAMCGLWMPTHLPYARDFLMELECRDDATPAEMLGPTALGIPNDSRCLGFDDQPFVYSHSVFGVTTPVGNLCLSRLGTKAEYSMSTFDAMLSDYTLEVVHPIDELVVLRNEEGIFHWSRQN